MKQYQEFFGKNFVPGGLVKKLSREVDILHKNGHLKLGRITVDNQKFACYNNCRNRDCHSSGGIT